MLETFTDIDSLNAVELLTVHNDLTANFDEMVDSTHLPKPYEPLLKDISQADDYLEKAASTILARLLPTREVNEERLRVRKGAFELLHDLQVERGTFETDHTTLRAILKQRKLLHERIPMLIDEFEE
jgi:hypothetical protein